MPGGRPRLPEHLKPVPVTIWVSPDVYDCAYRIARRYDLSINQLTRRVLERVFRTTKPLRVSGYATVNDARPPMKQTRRSLSPLRKEGGYGV